MTFSLHYTYEKTPLIVRFGDSVGTTGSYCGMERSEMEYVPSSFKNSA